MQVRDEKFRHNFSHENLKGRVHRVHLITGIIIIIIIRDADKGHVKGLTELMDIMVMVINLWIPYKVVNLHN